MVETLPRTFSPHACVGKEHTEETSEALAVFQFATFWLNAAAPLNVLAMLATDTVFQPEMFTLKADADRNICEQTTGYRA